MAMFLAPMPSVRSSSFTRLFALPMNCSTRRQMVRVATAEERRYQRTKLNRSSNCSGSSKLGVCKNSLIFGM